MRLCTISEQESAFIMILGREFVLGDGCWIDIMAWDDLVFGVRIP